MPATARAPSLFNSGDRRKATVACEPMVSVLTEVAKQLQPGRCVTCVARHYPGCGVVGAIER